MAEIHDVGTNATYGTSSPLLSELVPQFLSYGQYDRAFSKETIQKYRDCLKWIIKDIGDIPIQQLDVARVGVLKQKVADRGAGPSRMAVMVYVLKHLLRFCENNLGVPVMNPNLISPPKRPLALDSKSRLVSAFDFLELIVFG